MLDRLHLEPNLLQCPCRPDGFPKLPSGGDLIPTRSSWSVHDSPEIWKVLLGCRLSILNAYNRRLSSTDLRSKLMPPSRNCRIPLPVKILWYVGPLRARAGLRVVLSARGEIWSRIDQMWRWRQILKLRCGDKFVLLKIIQTKKKHIYFLPKRMETTEHLLT